MRKYGMCVFSPYVHSQIKPEQAWMRLNKSEQVWASMNTSEQVWTSMIKIEQVWTRLYKTEYVYQQDLHLIYEEWMYFHHIVEQVWTRLNKIEHVLKRTTVRWSVVNWVNRVADWTLNCSGFAAGSKGPKLCWSRLHYGQKLQILSKNCKTRFFLSPTVASDFMTWRALGLLEITARAFV